LSFASNFEPLRAVLCMFGVWLAKDERVSQGALAKSSTSPLTSESLLH